MTKKKLGQIFYTLAEIKMWQRELNELQCKSAVGSQQITGMPFTGGTTDKTCNAAIETVRVETIIKGLLARIQIEREEVLNYISTIDDSLIRQIINFRCVYCMNWDQVAMELGGYNTADCIRKTYDRFFEKKEGKKV